MEWKKIGQIQGRISRRRLFRNPTIQYIIINLLTKYDYSSLHSFTEIFDEKFHQSMLRFTVPDSKYTVYCLNDKKSFSQSLAGHLGIRNQQPSDNMTELL